MYLLLLFLPGLGSAFSGLFGRSLGDRGSQIVTSLSVFLSLLLSLVAFYEVCLSGSTTEVVVSTWILSEGVAVRWSFVFDFLSVSMLFPVLLVSFVVHIYSLDYMKEDPHIPRFFSYLSMFTFFMEILVTGENYFILFVGWELIGISSYLLINFWYTWLSANQGSMKAILTNRVGDIFMTLTFFSLLFIFGGVDYKTIYSLSPEVSISSLDIISFLLIVGSMGKSAQLGFHIWLPYSMVGPTPVSALIHAATLVTSGVYVVMRSSPLIEHSSTSLLLLVWVGCLTSFFTASFALYQSDLKRIIAYSTCSQMGYLFLSSGVSEYNLSLFHMMNHAFFKGLLFLSAGSIIHSSYDEQDLRRYGGYKNLLPYTYLTFVVGLLSLSAFPFFSGYYSKDQIIESSYGVFSFSGTYGYLFGVTSAVLTSLYSVRLVYHVFYSSANNSKGTYRSITDSSMVVMVSLTPLVVLSIYFGYIFQDGYSGKGVFLPYQDNSLYKWSSIENDIESLPSVVKVLPLVSLVLPFLLPKSVVLLLAVIRSPQVRRLSTSLQHGFKVDAYVNQWVSMSSLSIGRHLSLWVDQGMFEWVGPAGLGFESSSVSECVPIPNRGEVWPVIYSLLVVILLLLLLLLHLLQPNSPSWLLPDMRSIPIYIAVYLSTRHRKVYLNR